MQIPMMEDDTGFFVDVSIGSERLAMLVDTGANVTIIPERVFRALSPEARPPLIPVRGWVKIADGSRQKAAGQAIFKMRFPQFSADQLIWVADVDGDGMIGKDFLKSHGASVDTRSVTMDLEVETLDLTSRCGAWETDLEHFARGKTCRYLVTMDDDDEDEAVSDSPYYMDDSTDGGADEGPLSVGCNGTRRNGERGATRHGQEVPRDAVGQDHGVVQAATDPPIGPECKGCSGTPSDGGHGASHPEHFVLQELAGRGRGMAPGHAAPIVGPAGGREGPPPPLAGLKVWALTATAGGTTVNDRLFTKADDRLFATASDRLLARD